MNRAEIDELVRQYADAEGIDYTVETWDSTQYDDRSAAINYSFVRDRKPKVVVEFGARTGRCTHDILKALLRNGEPFVFKSYELEDDLRATAQRNLDRIFGDDAVTIGGDVMKAEDLPDNIDYLFVDNYHDVAITEWLFNTLFKKLRPGALVQIHDIPLIGDLESPRDSVFGETTYIVDLYKAGKLPLEKVYFTFEEGHQWESSWWIYRPL
jgi:predicted O-methyltransferase YrrM